MAARIARAAFKAEAMVLGMVPKSMLPMVQVYTNLGASLVQSASRLAPWAGAAGIFGVRADLPHWQWLLLTHLPFAPRVIVSRLDYVWLTDHPPLALMEPGCVFFFTSQGAALAYSLTYSKSPTPLKAGVP